MEETQDIKKNELYEKLVCALTHDIPVCTQCGKCGGKGNGVISRCNLVRALADYMNMPLPWIDIPENDR